MCLFYQDCSAFSGKLDRNSVFGIFVRQVILAAESNMFSGLSRLYQAFVVYLEEPSTAPRGILSDSQTTIHALQFTPFYLLLQFTPFYLLLWYTLRSPRTYIAVW